MNERNRDMMAWLAGVLAGRPDDNAQMRVMCHMMVRPYDVPGTSMQACGMDHKSGQILLTDLHRHGHLAKLDYRAFAVICSALPPWPEIEPAPAVDPRQERLPLDPGADTGAIHREKAFACDAYPPDARYCDCCGCVERRYTIRKAHHKLLDAAELKDDAARQHSLARWALDCGFAFFEKGLTELGVFK